MSPKNTQSKPAPAPPTLAAAVAPLPHFLCYVRVSVERETTGSHTFETQENRIIECLDRKCGRGQYTAEWFKDDGVSGGFGMNPTGIQSKTRPSLQVMADRITAGGVDGLVIYSQNRLFRNIGAMIDYMENVLIPNGVRLISATEDIDITSSDGRQMIYFKAILDQRVREDIVKRNKDAAATRAEAGYWLGQAPYGWRWESVEEQTSRRRNIVPVEAERQWVLHIKDRYLSGWNAYRIAKELNDLEISSPIDRELWSSKAKKQRDASGRKPKWSNSTVWNVLRSHAHAGLVHTPSGEFIPGRHGENCFWERETWEQIIEQNELRTRRFKSSTGRQNAPSLLGGLIFCARCGNRLYTTASSESTDEYRSYKCLHGRKNQELTCPDVVARAEWVENAVVEEIGNLVAMPEMRLLMETEVNAMTGQQDAQLLTEKGLLERKLSQLVEKFTRWADGYARGVMKERQFQTICKQMEVEEVEAQNRLAEIDKALSNQTSRQRRVETVREKLLDLPVVWESLDNDERRQLLALLIEDSKITVDRTGRDILLRFKLHLLPPCERIIIYRTYRGVNRTKATGLQLLTLRQMVLLHHARQGKSRQECAVLMKCTSHSIISMEQCVRKNLGDVTWKEAIEMSRERVETYKDQLPFNSAGKAAKTGPSIQPDDERPLLTQVLIEVLELFAQGATVLEAAQQLHLTPTTVQGRRSRILKLMGTSSMFEAVGKAKSIGWLK